MPTKGSELTSAEKKAKTLELRKTGATYRQIGAVLDISHVQAFRYVKSALKEINKRTTHDAEALRTLENERLDAMLIAVWGNATKGNFGAIDRALKIGKRRAELNGLDAPVKQDVEISVPTDETTDDERIARIAALLEQARSKRDNASD